MKRLVSVSAFEFSTQFSPAYYICMYSHCNIECIVLSENLGLLRNKYTLKLEGTEENIQMFLDYLKYEGFRIKK